MSSSQWIRQATSAIGASFPVIGSVGRCLAARKPQQGPPANRRDSSGQPANAASRAGARNGRPASRPHRSCRPGRRHLDHQVLELEACSEFRSWTWLCLGRRTRRLRVKACAMRNRAIRWTHQAGKPGTFSRRSTIRIVRLANGLGHAETRSVVRNSVACPTRSMPSSIKIAQGRGRRRADRPNGAGKTEKFNLIAAA